jgi:DNA-binding beta-propeller fold protein YncE
MMVLRRWCALLVAAVAACVNAPTQRAGLARVVWPPSPDAPRYVYEAVLRDSHSIRVESETERLRRVATGAEPPNPGFNKPLGVAARGGRVYVTDTEGRRVVVFDLARRRVFAFGTRLQGELRKPAGVAVAATGDVPVVDTGARRLIVYDALGLFKRSIDGRDWERPTGVAVNASGDRVYVVDTGGVESDAHRVFAYDQKGAARFVLGRRGSGEGEFNLPVDAAVAPDGTLYVLDAGNFRVQAFTPDGAYLRSFGSVGNGFGQFGRPRGIAVDGDGNVYVSDASFCNVQVFTAAGELLLALGACSQADGPGRYVLPAGVGVDESGRVYVVDQYFHKVEVLRRLSDDEGRRIAAERAR